MATSVQHSFKLTSFVRSDTIELPSNGKGVLLPQGFREYLNCFSFLEIIAMERIAISTPVGAGDPESG
jgi:hypothetical protein